MDILPTPDAVRASRLRAGLSQSKAASLVHLGSAMRWSDYERGIRSMDLARWELWLLLVGQHPTMRLQTTKAPKRKVGNGQAGNSPGQQLPVSRLPGQ